MARRVSILVACGCMTLALAVTVCADSHGGSEPALDPIMGEFAGTLHTAAGQDVKAEANVLADEDCKYRVYILCPAAADAKPARIELAGVGKDGKVSITSAGWSGTVGRESLAIVSQKGAKAEMQRVVRKSPTLGEKPPAGAVVLLPFEKGRPTSIAAWNNQQWPCLPDGSILSRGGDTGTKQKFSNYKLHVEFRVPFMPSARGQGRGNSGVYQLGNYEIQVLDSFGLTMNPGECGAIYGIKAPDVNAALPPGQWQTYDIDFQAPKIDAAGQQTRGAIISVLWNGVQIHKAVEVTRVTGGSMTRTPVAGGPIRLQYHGNPARFRNIWLVEAK